MNNYIKQLYITYTLNENEGITTLHFNEPKVTNATQFKSLLPSGAKMVGIEIQGFAGLKFEIDGRQGIIGRSDYFDWNIEQYGFINSFRLIIPELDENLLENLSFLNLDQRYIILNIIYQK